MRYKIQAFLPIVLLMLISSISTQSQNSSNYWVYDLVETQASYELRRTNALDMSTTTITTITKTPSFNLRSIMPQEELAAAETWFTGSVSTPIGASIPDYFESPPQTRVINVAAAPNGMKVALTLTHSQCSGQSNFKCFGVSQVVIVDTSTGEQSTLWTLPHSADSPHFPYCYVEFSYELSSVETGIADIQWLPDHSAIVARIYYESSGFPPDNPLIIIPIDAPQNAFAAGNGEGGWVIMPDSSSIASVSRDCDSLTRENDIVRITTFDLETNQYSFQDYPLSIDIANLGRIFTPSYIQGELIFPVVKTTPNPAAIPPIFRLGKLDPSEVNSMSILAGSISSFQQVGSSLSGEIAVVEDVDGHLWNLVLGDNDFLLLPITSTPVSYWQFANDEELVVQFVGDTQFSIAEIPPSIICDTTVPANDTPALISAITTANGAGTAQTLCLEGTYTLNAVNNSSTDGKNGLPVITGDITLFSTNGATITRDPAAPAFRIAKVGAGGQLTLNNLTLSNGSAVGAGSRKDGGGIFNDGTLTIINTTFQGHVANRDGGAIWSGSGASLTISGGTFTTNTANEDGGAISGWETTLTIDNGTVFSSNSASSDGGAIDVGGAVNVTIIDTIFNQNNASSGGAVFADNTLTLDGTSFTLNTASSDGGAIFSNKTLQVTNSLFDGNTATNFDGGAIYSTIASAVTLDNTILKNNTSGGNGGALYGWGATITIQNGTQFNNNSANNDGGAMETGGVTNTTITNATFDQNSATRGGGIFADNVLTVDNTTFTLNTAATDGGAIYNLDTLQITNSLFDGNAATLEDGGAIYNPGSTSLSIDATTFNQNTANGDGGGLYNGGTATVTNSGFSFNNANNDGGGIANTGTLTFDNGTIGNNSAANQGGGVRSSTSAGNHIHFSCIENNTAADTTGVYSSIANFDASNNWWGNISGPLSGQINGDVTTSPFNTISCVDAMAGS